MSLACTGRPSSAICIYRDDFRGVVDVRSCTAICTATTSATVRRQLQPVILGATDQSRTDDLRFTKPLRADSRGNSAPIFDRLKSIDSEIETLHQERRSLTAQLELLAREMDEE